MCCILLSVGDNLGKYVARTHHNGAVFAGKSRLIAIRMCDAMGNGIHPADATTFWLAALDQTDRNQIIKPLQCRVVLEC